jgi:hypothetical protein
MNSKKIKKTIFFLSRSSGRQCCCRTVSDKCRPNHSRDVQRNRYLYLRCRNHQLHLLPIGKCHFSIKTFTKCAKDCGPHNHACKNGRSSLCCFYAAQEVFKDGALIFFSTGEELSQPNKLANKIIISIFLTVRATILDKQSKSNNYVNSEMVIDN